MSCCRGGCVFRSQPDVGLDLVRTHSVNLVQVLDEKVEGKVDDEDQTVPQVDVFPPLEF